MSRFLFLLLLGATLAACAENGGRLFNDPLPADPQARAGTHDASTMAGAGGSFKTN